MVLSKMNYFSDFPLVLFRSAVSDSGRPSLSFVTAAGKAPSGNPKNTDVHVGQRLGGKINKHI